MFIRVKEKVKNFPHDTSRSWFLTICSYHIFCVFAVPFLKPSSAWSCPTSKNFKIFEKFEHRPFTWYIVLWGLNVYLDLWKQKYTSQKFSKKYKNPYFCPTLELVKITMILRQQGGGEGLSEISDICWHLEGRVQEKYWQLRAMQKMLILRRMLFQTNNVRFSETF